MKPFLALALCFVCAGLANAQLKQPTESAMDRFLRYVKIDTQSQEEKPIRGGTDGSTLTFQGLPTPNLFTGGWNFHGKLEFNSRRGLEKTTETLINLVQIFTGKT